MKENFKNICGVIAIISTILIINYWAISFSSQPVSYPADFYGTSEEVPLEEFLSYAKENNFSIYLPTKFPKGFIITAIYLKREPFIAIVVYSNEENKDYKTSGFTIEISHINPKYIPTLLELQALDESSQYIYAKEINNWTVMIHEHASIGGNPETKAKFGDYGLIAQVWIDCIEYLYCIPLLSKQDEISQIIETMVQIV
ncbi:MAG: hypothetical protein ACTSUX_05930 [Promethearchaeota archaeon]